MVVIDQTDGTSLGIDVDKSDHLRMIVEKVNGGLIGEWNKTHPTMKVRGSDGVQAVWMSQVPGPAAPPADVCMDTGPHMSSLDDTWRQVYMTASMMEPRR